MFQPGDKIDDVEIVARLRAGGMAALYLARRVGAGGFSKDLAVKVIHAHLASDNSFVEMFVDEARLSARIDHPNVVRVESLKQHDDAYCLLMEFVHGCSLSQLMGTLKKRDYRFSPELAVAIAIRVADGLHAAHELLNPDGTAAGVVHRDVSPANVLVGYRGDVKLIDFGIAKATQRLHQTEAAGLKGKIAYMSPEQAFGRDIDRRTDVYALGIVLWEMLTMRRLFKADNDLRLLDMVREPKVVPPGAVVPDLPPALDRVVLDALSADKDRRPATARDLRYRLLDALPSAAAIDPLQISAVVCEVMQDKIAEDREMLSISSFNALPGPSEKESVTVSRLLRPASSGVEPSIEDLAQAAEELAPGFQGATTQHTAPPTLLPQTSALMTPPSLVTEVPKKRKVVGILLGAAAALGLAVGGVTGIAFSLMDDDSTAQAADAPPEMPAPQPPAASPPRAEAPTEPVEVQAPEPVEEPEEADPAETAAADDVAEETLAEAEPPEVADDRPRARSRRGSRRSGRGGRRVANRVERPRESAPSSDDSRRPPAGNDTSRGGPTQIIRDTNVF